MPAMDFWFDFGSTYSYPAAMRIESASNRAGVDLRWRPFALGAVFVSQGWPADSPFNWQPSKGAHMWRDMERVCQAMDLPLKRPDPFPQNSINAARVALIAIDEGWGGNFVRAVFTEEFANGAQIGDFSVLARIVRSLGRDADEILERSRTAQNKDRLKTETEAAQRAGVFGAPTFVTSDGELFWGNDRLEHAVYWASHGTLEGFAAPVKP